MINKNKSILLISILIIVSLSIFFFIFEDKKGETMENTNTDNEKKSQPVYEEVGKNNKSKSKKTTETRTVEFHLDKEFIVDQNRNSFKSNEKGMIKGNILYIHSTIKEEQRAVYAFLENDNTPIEMEIEGKEGYHHIIDIPKKGTKKVDFTIADLPPGKHIIYIISEKVLNNNVNDPLEIYETQQTVARNYISVAVNNENRKISKIQNIYTPSKKIQSIDKETSVQLRMYEDSNLTKEVESIKKGNYFLAIENPHDFGLKAHLKLISEYVPLEFQSILIPPKAKVMVPINLKDYKISNSIRIIMVGEPAEKLDLPLPLRIVKETFRFPVEN